MLAIPGGSKTELGSSMHAVFLSLFVFFPAFTLTTYSTNTNWFPPAAAAAVVVQ